ncbi:DUF4256 domain-containing protein [Arenibacter sp. BSSL-BM3]|uniref:DUF4256 domain-containing protein n=1 Tax=Arenibacter arenosicollis TaxID=2762274 RepID=A0ABR7QTK3_9FLAO|nr:DUF4256 domain-containing protein [Arenibacter arenosicollis]MBC8770404.1 DUF4256 domain-containing protein [Arenibacter arenosicollis]
MNKMKLTEKEHIAILEILKSRFNQNIDRHNGFEWDAIENRLKEDPGKIWSLNAMEKSGGEPDVVDFDSEKGEYIFFDCSAESPTGRRSACYDHEAQESRKKFKPNHNACDLAAAMGVNILNEDQYRYLQKLGKFDAKTSSWIQTPSAIRKLGGALFADFRYNHVFIYHNGADSYYAARGFRASFRV